jgi:hypothetical protein
MITRIFNLILSSGFTLMAAGSMVDESGDFSWPEILFSLLTVCWFAGAIGLFFRSRLAWSGSMLGVGAMFAGSIALILSFLRFMTISTDPTEGSYMIIFGLFGLALSLPVFIGLVRLRKTLFSSTI